MLKPVALFLAFLGLTVDAAVASQDCPIINGTFFRKVKVDGGTLTYTLEHYTRVDKGVARYTFAPGVEGDFPADGKPHDIAAPGVPPGKITIRCESGTVAMSVYVAGSGDYRRSLKAFDANTVELTIEDTRDPNRNGIYRKE